MILITYVTPTSKLTCEPYNITYNLGVPLCSGWANAGGGNAFGVCPLAIVTLAYLVWTLMAHCGVRLQQGFGSSWIPLQWFSPKWSSTCLLTHTCLFIMLLRSDHWLTKEPCWMKLSWRCPVNQNVVVPSLTGQIGKECFHWNWPAGVANFWRAHFRHQGPIEQSWLVLELFFGLLFSASIGSLIRKWSLGGLAHCSVVVASRIRLADIV